MTDGWVEAGRLAKLRRERLGLKQEELQDYGGPKVATVGKFERAAQKNFPPRTQHEIENALGWPRGSIESIIQAAADDDWKSWAEDFEERLVQDNLPDLSRTPPPVAGSPTVTYRVRAGALDVEVTVEGPVESMPELRESVRQLINDLNQSKG